MSIEAEQRVKAAFPGARVMSGVVGGKTKYRIEDASTLHIYWVLSGWKETQALAWESVLNFLTERLMRTKGIRRGK